MTRLHALIQLAACMAMLTLFALPLLAQEEPAVIKAFYDTYAEIGGTRPSHENLSLADDGTITITGMKMVLSNYQAEGVDIQYVVDVKSAVFKGVTELESGLFEVSEVSYRGTGVSLSGVDDLIFSGSMPVLEMKGLIIRSPALLKTSLDRWLASNLLAKSARVPLLTINFDEVSLDLHDVGSSWTGDVKSGLGEWVFNIGSMKLPDKIVQEAKDPMPLKDLGYDEIIVGFAGRSSIAVSNDLIDIGMEFAFKLKDMGTFTMAADMRGIQPALIETAQSLQENPESLDVNKMMGQAQSIKVAHFKLRYDDASLVGRVLDYYARTENMSREQLIEESVQAGGSGMMFLNTPKLAKQANEALRAFLQNPGWIQLEAKPAEPVAITSLMQLFAAPPEIVKLLQISVTSGPPATNAE